MKRKNLNRNCIIFLIFLVTFFSCNNESKKQKTFEKKEIKLSSCDFLTNRGIPFRMLNKITATEMEIRILEGNKLLKSVKEKLKIRYDEKLNFSFFSWSGDTINTSRNYEFKLLNGKSEVLQFFIDSIILKSRPVYNGNTCSFESFRLNGIHYEVDAGTFDLGTLQEK